MSSTTVQEPHGSHYGICTHAQEGFEIFSVIYKTSLLRLPASSENECMNQIFCLSASYQKIMIAFPIDASEESSFFQYLC